MSMPPNPFWHLHFSREVTLRRVGNVIDLMSGSLCEYPLAFYLTLQAAKVCNRAQAIRWLKQVALDMRVSPEARDCGVQIFDMFLYHTETEDMNSQSNIDFISYSVAASLILGSKLHDGKRCLSLNCFHDFRTDLLRHYECLILNRTAFSISPQITPISFVQEFLFLWKPATKNCELLKISDSLIAKFWEEPSSTLFAPSTIAISALILSFSILKVDCSDWLGSMPNFCLLPVHNASCIKSPDSRFFDIDGCLRSFRNVLKSCSRYRQACQTPTTSPTCVAGDIESPTQRQHTALNPINLKRKLDQSNLVEVLNERQLNPRTGPSSCSTCPMRGADQWTQKIATTPPQSTDAGLTFIPQDFPSKVSGMSVMLNSRQDTAVIVAAPLRSQAPFECP